MAEKSDYTRKKKLLMSAGYAALIIAVYYIVFRYAIYIAWPFVIALVIVLATRRPTLFIVRRFHIPEKASSIIVISLVYLIFAGIFIFVVLKAFWAIVDWTGSLPSMYQDKVAPVIEKGFAWLADHSANDESDIDYLSQIASLIISKLQNAIGWVSSKAVSLATGFAVGIPKTMLGLIFMIISTYFIAVDFRRINRFFMNQFNPNQQQIIVSTREFLGSGITGIVVSYGIIMLITFIELNIGLRIIHIDNPTSVALIIAIFDILPALGCGGIMIPWTIIELVNGNVSLALKLFIVYAIITVIRNIIEPKIVGENIGVHPVLMLMSIYLGALILGPLGIIIMPFTIIVIKRLNDSGLINVFKSEA